MSSIVPGRTAPLGETAVQSLYQYYDRHNKPKLKPLSLPTTTHSTACGYPMLYLRECTSPSPTEQITNNSLVRIGKAIMEIRRLSGLTWQELSSLFNVSHQIFNQWANGKPLPAGQNYKVGRMLRIVRSVYQGSQSETRANLLKVNEETGKSLYHLIQQNSFDEIMDIIDNSDVRRTGRTYIVHTSEEEQNRRKPPPPWLFLESEPGILKTKVGRVRRVRPRQLSK